MKSIMISVQPKWVEKILNGEKTIEIRKTKPSCELPVKVYIYCTKGKKGLSRCYLTETDKENKKWTFSDRTLQGGRFRLTTLGRIDGKVVAEFILNKVEKYAQNSYPLNSLYTKSCLNATEISNYAKGESVYLWHISDLKVYDKPRELGEFCKPVQEMIDNLVLCTRFCEPNICKEMNTHPNNICEGCYCEENRLKLIEDYKLTKAPQSWCYVEEV